MSCNESTEEAEAGEGHEYDVSLDNTMKNITHTHTPQKPEHLRSREDQEMKIRLTQGGTEPGRDDAQAGRSPGGSSRCGRVS